SIAKLNTLGCPMKTRPGAAASPLGFLARLVTAGVLSGASVAGMAATIVFTSTLPTEDVFSRNDNVSPSGASVQVRNVNAATNNRWVGTSFTAPADVSLDRFTFHIHFDAEGNGLMHDAAKGATM